MKTKLDTEWTQRAKLHAEGDLVFINAVIAECGKDACIEWTDSGCIVQGVMGFLNEN